MLAALTTLVGRVRRIVLEVFPAMHQVEMETGEIAIGADAVCVPLLLHIGEDREAFKRWC